MFAYFKMVKPNDLHSLWERWDLTISIDRLMEALEYWVVGAWIIFIKYFKILNEK